LQTNVYLEHIGGNTIIQPLEIDQISQNRIYGTKNYSDSSLTYNVTLICDHDDGCY